jgi:valyl-tRNA synthetase
MMGLEFADDVPFDDVYVHSVVLAPDGRRMSKSMGTGIDPLDAIEEHGADALRFGLMAMSSSQDVKYSLERVEQGRALANKMWNASRLVLLNTDAVEPGPRPETAEDRWILTRLQRTIAKVGERMDAYDFSHAALDLYTFFWSEFCDWYLEMVKPRLYGDPPADSSAGGTGSDREAVSATLLHVLEETLALAHPITPFVTEEIYRHMPHARDQLAVRRFPRVDEGLIDEEAERTVEAVIEATRRLRRYRDIAGVPAAARLAARLVPEDDDTQGLYERSKVTIERLARFEFEIGADGAGSGLTIPIPGAAVEVLPSEAFDAGEAKARISAYLHRLRKEIETAQGRLANPRFVEKAPGEVVQEWRDKLAGYERELAELER